MTGSIDTITLFPLSAEVAWQRYLEATRAAGTGEYEQVEEEAWDQLQLALSRVRGATASVA
jgi:hypothetical protein